MYLNIIVNIIIVFSVIIFFFLAVIANGLTKAPENIELPVECHTCSNSCIIKFDRGTQTKESIQEFYQNCEENSNEDKKESWLSFLG